MTLRQPMEFDVPMVAPSHNSLPATALCLVVLLSALGCGQTPTPTSPVRLGELLPTTDEQRVSLASHVTLSNKPTLLATEIDAPSATALEITAQGSARRLEINWQLSGEQQFYDKRTRGLVLEPGDEPRTYTLELQGHRAWGGRVEALKITAQGGTLDVSEVAARIPASPYRSVEIDRRLIPSLTGRQRLEVELPKGLPQGLEFESLLGVLPAARGEGVKVRFAAWVETGDGTIPWFDRELTTADGLDTWHRVRIPVDASAGGRLVLVSEASQDGTPRSPSSVVWGQPQLHLKRHLEAGTATVDRSAAVGETPAHNVVIIAIDTLRADVLGSYGNDEGLTPHLDALAADGYRLADLASPAPWTLPSFATLMTGLQPQSHEAGHRLVVEGKFHSDQITRLDGEHVTLAEVLSEEGFRTAGFYTNTFLSPSFGLHQGFDEYQGFAPLTRAGTVVDEALEWLAPVGSERYFLFLHVFDPHSPYRPPDDVCRGVANRLAPQEDELPCLAERSVKEEQIPRTQRPWANALYRAEVAYTDAQIGRFLKTLRARPDGDQTLILLISDHGEEFWEHEDQRQALGYHPLAGHGHTQYQELLHVPAILDLPGDGHGDVQQATETADLFPTLLALLGIEAPAHQGRDLRPQLTGERVSEPLRLSDFQLYGPPRWSARRGPWKLVVRAGESETLELYHLDDDPGELHDLADERPDIVEELRRSAEAEFVARAGRRLGRPLDDSGQAAQLGEEELERLRTLGYLQ